MSAPSVEEPMRFVSVIVALMLLGVSARAMPLAPLLSVPAGDVVQVKMSNATMTCKEMMRMHHKMMGAKKTTCQEMMRMHHKMMAGNR